MPYINVRVEFKNEGMNVGDCVLNASLPLRLHTSSIKRVFYSCSTTSLFEEGFILRCFQNLSLNA